MKKVLGFIIYVGLLTSLTYPICAGLSERPDSSNWFEYYIIAAGFVAFLILSDVISTWVFNVLEIK